MHAGYELSEVRIEQWLLAALQMQRGLGLAEGRRRGARSPNKSRRTAAAGAGARGSLWVMLALSVFGLCVL
ncbi:MAG: hypothetical protein ACM3PU_12555 [Gemmatimonadota bacterium]